MPLKDNNKALIKAESKDVAIYTFITFLTGLGNFLIVPLFWTKLTPSDYGIIAITEIVSTILSAFLGLSLDQGLTRFYHEWKDEEKKGRIGTLWLTSWVSSLICGVLSILLLIPLTKFLFPELTFFPFIFYGILISILSSFTLIPFATIRIQRLSKLYAVYRITTFIIQMGFLIFFIIFMNTGVIGYFYGGIISGIINMIIMAILMLRLSKPIFKINYLTDSLWYSLPLIPSAIVNYFTSILDRFLLQQFASLSTLGIYSISLKFSGLISQMQTALKLSYVPFLFRTVSESKKGSSVVQMMTSYYLLPLFLAGLCINLLVDDFAYFTKQTSYFPIINIVPFLVYITILNSLYLYFAPGILLSKKTKYVMYPNLVQLVFLGVVGILLINSYQVYGILVSKFISTLAYIVISIFLSYYLYNWKNNYKPIFVFFLLSAGLLMIDRLAFHFSHLMNFILDIGLILIFILLSFLYLGLLREIKNYFTNKKGLVIFDKLK